MKLKLHVIMMMTAALFMAACSEDDPILDDDDSLQNITGTYKGYTVAEFQYTTIPITTADESISLIANDNSRCNLSFESAQWGKFTISDAVVTINSDNYTITGSGKTVMGMETQSEYDCTVTGTISKDKKTVSFVFDVPSVMGGLKITYSSGDAPLNKVIAGTYNGYTVAEFQYTTIPMTKAGEKISMTANDNGTSTISFESGTWGTFTISDVAVSFKDNAYSIAGSGKTLMGMDPASQKEYDCTVEGVISSDKETVSLIFNVPAVMGGLKITFAEGDAPASMVIAGVYEGTLAMSVAGASQGTVDDSQVTIKAQENGKAELTLTAFSTQSGMGFTEDIVIADVDVTAEEDGSYILEGIVDTTSGTSKVTGSIGGAINEGKAELQFSLKPGSMPMNIDCIFTSK